MKKRPVGGQRVDKEKIRKLSETPKAHPTRDPKDSICIVFKGVPVCLFPDEKEQWDKMNRWQKTQHAKHMKNLINRGVFKVKEIKFFKDGTQHTTRYYAKF